MATNAWDHAAGLAEQHASSGSIFVRLANNGDKVVGAFCGEPYAREVVWTGERYETYDAAVHTDKRPSLRVMLNFFVPAEGAMKVIEGGALWFKDILKVRNKYGLDKWLFEIERHGEAGDSKTRYSVLPERQIDDEMRARIAAAGLHDLASIGTDEEGEGAGAGPQGREITCAIAVGTQAALCAVRRRGEAAGGGRWTRSCTLSCVRSERRLGSTRATTKTMRS